jgi:Tfp pilus assembly protein PilF
MKKILIALFLTMVQISFAQDCNTRAANRPSESVRFQDDFIRSVEDPKANISTAKLKPQLTVAENWVKGILKNFTGAKLAYSNEYFFDYTSGFTKDFYKASGIKGCYSSKMRFYAYYCYDNRNEIFTEDESGSFAAVYFNNVFMPSLCTDVGVFTVNGKYAFKMFEKSRTEGRIDYYEQIAMSNVYDTIYKSKHDFIIIRNSDQPVFLPITRKEYLQQLLKDVDDYKSREMASAKADYTPANETANKARFDEELKRIDNSKNYTAEQMAPYRKRFIETWETEKQKFDKRIARIETETTQAKEVLQEYLKKPQEWLNRSFQQFYGYSTYTGKGIREYLEKLDVFTYITEEETRTYVASINPAYFNKSLSADIPQLIMVHLPKSSYPHMQKVAALVKKPGALAPLENLLIPGKRPVEQPLVVTTSTYKLSYLPKLNKLTPVVVPADMKPSMVSVTPVNNSPVTKINFDIPSLSPKLKELPTQAFTPETYKNYVLDLHTKISTAIKPEIKKKADDYLANKKLKQSKDIGNTAFAAWLQNTPEASLYLYSKAVVNDPSDALTANNFSAFLMMGGLPEKSIPILEFWNKQKPGESTLLANLGNAYFRLGDVNNAMKYLQQCVQKDSLHPTANKLLCIMYLKKGDVKKAEEHATRSITTCHDEQVVSILRQLNRKVKVGEIMSRFPLLPEKEFPMLKRIQLPAMPSGLNDMEQFAIELNAMKQSVNMTIDAIAAKYPKVDDDIQQQMLMAGFKNGLSPMRIKAQHIIMDGMQIYHEEQIKEDDVFKYNLKKLNTPHAVKMKAIQKKYDDQLSKLEGGEAGDEDKIQALELAKCKDLNEETQAYLVPLSSLVNQHVQRREYISRKFFRDYANWAPYWVPQTTISFPPIERDYLKDIANILSDYKLVSKMDCSIFEPLPVKEGTLQEWEDEYCANFKGKIAMGPVKFFFTCNSWGMDGGEGIVGDFEFKYRNDGYFENLTIGAGLGANWHLGKEGFIKTEIGASVKEFIKIGPDAATGKWIVQDFGVKAEVAGEASFGKVSVEEKVFEASVAVNAGFEMGGIVPSVFNLK